MYKLIFLQFALSGLKSIKNLLATVFFFATESSAEFHSLSIGRINCYCSQSLSCAVNWAESSGFMALFFIFTGVSSPGLSSTLATIQSVLPATPCPITWSLLAPPSNTWPFFWKTLISSSPTSGLFLMIGLS